MTEREPPRRVAATANDDRPGRLWHALPADDVARVLDSGPDGLNAVEAAARLRQWGANAIAATPATSAWRILGNQLRSVVMLLLVGAAVVAAVSGERTDAAAIGAVLLLNVAIGFALEMRAHRAVEALAALEPHRAVILRDGHGQEIAAEDVVPGDLLLLDEGQAVAADARLIESADLRVVEATLTGESVPVSKRADAAVDPAASLPDRVTMVFAGTTVSAGTARALVVETGSRTELGRIGSLVTSTPVERSPLERHLDRLGAQLVWIALFVGLVTALLTWIRGVALAEVVGAAVAVAAAAVPEGLPAVATIALAMSVHRMARRHALVRRLPSVETLGSVTVLCTDKTGTLTAGAMTVTTVVVNGNRYSITGEGYEPVGTFELDGVTVDAAGIPSLRLALRTAAAASRGDAVRAPQGWVARGDPTDVAAAVAARKAGIDRAAIARETAEAGEVPFSSVRRLTATFHRREDGAVVASVKGAPQRVLELCTHESRGQAIPLDEAVRARLLAENDALAAQGLRVLALATGAVSRAEESALTGLTFVGFIGVTDPLASGVKEAVRSFADAGIRTVMITGDQRGTAEAIARNLGLPHSATLEGREIDGLSDAALEQRLQDVAVFSRVSPDAKVRIVSAFQRRGEVVAMIGDGVNDAAALRKADVGVTMGRRGTDVARETAVVVLEDDRFETIGTAIEEGRLVFDNIRKFVFYLFSCNLAELLVLMVASAAGIPMPPIQVLWLNLITDTVPALALAFEPAAPGLMRQPPRAPSTAIVSWEFMRAVSLYAALIASASFVVLAWAFWSGVPRGQAMTMNFMALAFAQLTHLGNARDAAPVIRFTRAFANRMALAALALSVALQLLTVADLPLRELLRLEPLSAQAWAVVLLAGSIPGLLGQAAKAMRAS